MALVTIIFVLALLLFLILLFKEVFISPKNDRVNLLTIALLFFIVFLVFLGFTLYDSLNVLENNKDYTKIGPYGDYIGGIVNPLISFFAIIAAGFAFYAQYQANRQVQDQFKILQFESRLYKMIDIYNLNVSNIKFIGRKSGNSYEGKRAFSHLIRNSDNLKKEILGFNKIRKIDLLSIVKRNYNDKLTELTNKSNIPNFIVLELCYIIFFYGVGVNGRKDIKSILKDKYQQDYLKKLLNYLSHKSVEYDTTVMEIGKWSAIDIFLDDFENPNNNKFDKFYNGHQNNLGHYYRHIFMIIKYINEQEYLTYDQKWNYAKLLRTQLSNHEQELFFLNSISIFGREWELNHSDENIRLITKFDLIKNLSKAVRDKYRIKDFYPNVVFEDAKNTDYRENLEKNIYY